MLPFPRRGLHKGWFVSPGPPMAVGTAQCGEGSLRSHWPPDNLGRKPPGEGRGSAAGSQAAPARDSGTVPSHSLPPCPETEKRENHPQQNHDTRRAVVRVTFFRPKAEPGSQTKWRGRRCLGHHLPLSVLFLRGFYEELCQFPLTSQAWDPFT